MEKKLKAELLRLTTNIVSHPEQYNLEQLYRSIVNARTNIIVTMPTHVLYMILEFVFDHRDFYQVLMHRPIAMAFLRRDAYYDYMSCLPNGLPSFSNIKTNFAFCNSLIVNHCETFARQSAEYPKQDIMFVFHGKSCCNDWDITDNKTLGNLWCFWESRERIEFKQQFIRMYPHLQHTSHINAHECIMLSKCGGKQAISPFEKTETCSVFIMKHNRPVWFVNAEPLQSFAIFFQA